MLMNFLSTVGWIVLLCQAASFFQIAEQDVNRTFNQFLEFVTADINEKRIGNRQRNFDAVFNGNVDCFPCRRF